MRARSRSRSRRAAIERRVGHMRYNEEMGCLYGKLERGEKRVELYEQHLAQAEAVVKSVGDQLARAKSDVRATNREIRELWARRLEEERRGPAADPAL